jgi:YVTN family beta-propeller protein
MKHAVLLITVLASIILIISGCDKAPVTGSASGENIGQEGAMIILNNLGESISVAYPDGNIKNNVQLTGESPNDIIADPPYIYVINSLNNSVLVLDDSDLRVVSEIGLGTGKNPMSACVISPGVIAVTEFRKGLLDIVDIKGKKILNTVDLNSIALPSDVAGIAGSVFPSGVAYASGCIFICLSNLTDAYGGLTSAGSGAVAVIDAVDYSLKETVVLKGSDPVFARPYGSKVIIACAGKYGGNILTGGGGFKGDGTIEVIDAETLVLDSSIEVNAAPFSFSVSNEGLLYASNAMGGNIPKVALTSSEVSYITTDAGYISSVCTHGSNIYALDFSNDRLLAIDGSGATVAAYTVGDGPIAVLYSDAAGAEGEEITAKIEILPDVASTGSVVVFDASSSAAPQDAIYTWDFGDGTSRNGKVVSHSYACTGSFKASLVITADGKTDKAEGSVNVFDESPFAAFVVDYSPAPGQFVSNSRYNNSLRALGSPVGGGPFQPGNSSQVSLGAFGGSITLGFDHVIADREGLDFIIFGNSQYDRAPLRFIEPGTVEISLDGITWYLMPGSALPAFPLEKACMSYAGEADEFCAYKLPSTISDTLSEGKYLLYGYADLSPVMPLPEGTDSLEFYTLPDDPVTAGIDEGTCGGDAFDISWAVNPATGDKSGLTGFRYIRITTAVSADLGGDLGECSTEVDAVAEVCNKLGVRSEE